MKPYIRKIGKFRGFDIWYVDGGWVRKNLNEEFTNFGENNNFKFIPSRELWIDKEFGDVKEWRYFVKFFISKINYLKKGKKQKEAIRLATLIEQKERSKDRAVKKLKKLSRKKQVDNIHKIFLKKYSNENVKIWIVNGFLVRSLDFIDFTEGGHDYVYKFVPSGEIWIDDALNPEEMKFVVLHEAHERNLMRKGMSYSNAHKLSSKIELYCRKHPGKTDKLLKRELEKQE